MRLHPHRGTCAVSCRAAVFSRDHAIDATRGDETRPWVLRFSNSVKTGRRARAEHNLDLLATGQRADAAVRGELRLEANAVEVALDVGSAYNTRSRTKALW